jgi:hypothetical protein
MTPALRPVTRAAIEDVAYHVWSAIGTNLIWGLTLIWLLLVLLGAPALAVVLAPLLALPTAACYRLAGTIVRGGPVSGGDALRMTRSAAIRALGVGVASVIIGGVLLVNLLSGLVGSGGPVGWAIGTAALWGLLAGWVILLHLWPVLADPARADRRLRDLLRLAVTVALARPGRALVLVLASTLIVVVSTILFAALATLAVVFVACLGCRWVLPSADALEPSLRADRQPPVAAG